MKIQGHICGGQYKGTVCKRISCTFYITYKIKSALLHGQTVYDMAKASNLGQDSTFQCRRCRQRKRLSAP